MNFFDIPGNPPPMEGEEWPQEVETEVQLAAPPEGGEQEEN